MLAIKRQAVVIMHGMGEQKPMDTLRAFVKTIAPEIRNAHEGTRKVFNKPDNISESFELRRFTSNKHGDSHKTDYFEYYWANKVSGKTIGDIIRWFVAILLRMPNNVPLRVRWIYYSIWFLILLALFFFVAFSLSLWSFPFFEKIIIYLSNPYILGIYGLIATAFSTVVINYLGDVVCYTNASPKNINEREEIRKKGIELLQKLLSKKEKDGSNSYDRVVIVGHSLGTVIAYDLIKFLWSRYNENLNLKKKLIVEIEEASKELSEGRLSVEAFQEVQSKIWQSQYHNPDSWRISDFITLGSPIAISDLLLADSRVDLFEKQKDREFPTCPPTPEKSDEFHFNENILHHAALFALTKWTNICFKKDFVGGKIEVFGKGIINYFESSDKSLRNVIPFVAHTKYWDFKEIKMIDLIRRTINFRI